MSQIKPTRRIAVVGTGVIGASWAAFYLSRGFDVVATDPAPNAEAALRKYVDEAWVLLAQYGLADGASRERLTFTPSLRVALAEARASGVTPFCITFDQGIHEEEFVDIFEGTGYTIIDDVLSLPERLPGIYRRLTS